MIGVLDSEIEDKINALAKSFGLVIYDIEWAKENENKILRIYITKSDSNSQNSESKNGVTLDDCANFSNSISPLLDVELNEASKYFLEVSSPGLERILKKPRHFELSINEELEVKLLPDENGQKRVVRGILKAQDGEKIILDSQNQSVQILFSQIKKAKTIFEF